MYAFRKRNVFLPGKFGFQCFSYCIPLFLCSFFGFTSLTQCSKEGCRFTRCRSVLTKHGTLLEAAGTKQLEFGNYSFS